jgi:hypothetical protein
MSEQVKIQKTIYNSKDFNNVVDTNFSQLINTKPSPAIEESINESLDNLYNLYNTLYFDIPPSGSDDSHLGIATRSLDFLGLSLDDLRNEIENLREENIGLKTQLLDASQINIGTQI